MKKGIKSFISFLLALLMLMSLLNVVPVLADEDTSAVESGEEEEETLNEEPYLTTIYGSVAAKIDTMTEGIDNGKMRLYYDPASGEVAVENLETGEFLMTNPYNVSSTTNSSGATVGADIKRTLLSQIIIKYTENDKEYILNSFSDAAIDKQIEVMDIRGGLRVEYSIGREEVRLLIPECVTEDDFLSIYNQILANSEGDFWANKFKSYYLYKAINPEDPQSTRLSIELKWPIIEKIGPIYVIDQALKQAEKLKIEEIVKTYTDLTFEKIEEMHATTEYVSTSKEPALFKLALEYTLNDDGVSVRLSANNIRFDSSNYKLENITYLPYMGAGDIDNEGYVFTPDGSGSLINFADVEGRSIIITDTLYGNDFAFHDITTGANREVMRLPVFGMIQEIPKWTKVEVTETYINDKGEEETRTTLVDKETPYNSGFLAIIESGASLSDISIENGGITHNRIMVYTKFNPRPKDSYELTGGLSAGTDAKWTVESDRKYTGDFKIRYIMLKDDDATYAGMARAYQEYLVEAGVLEPIEDVEEDIPIYIETLGAIETVDRILGIPVDEKTALSSFDKTMDYLDTLRQYGVSNVKLKLTGWINGGMEATVPYNLDIEKVLGGSDEFERLVEYANQNNIELFPDFEFVFAKLDKRFDGFSYKTDSVKTIDNRSAQYRVYDFLTQDFKSKGWIILSPNVVEEFYDAVYEKYSTYNVGGISVSNIGSILTSDFNKKAQLNREDSVVLYTRMLEKVKEQNGNVLVNGGNYYTLPYVTDILEVPLENSRSIYSMASVPFMGMVLHGYVEFAGTPINMAGDYRYAVMKTIENGASPYFIVALENASDLSAVGYTEYYSVRASIWLQSMIDTYAELNEAMKDIQNVRMIGHEFLDSESRVVKVTYENGVSFVLNYTLKDFEYEIVDEEGNVTDSYVIPSEDFVKFDKNGAKVNE